MAAKTSPLNEVLAVPMCFQYVEVLLSTATVITYYASGTYFSGSFTSHYNDFTNFYGQMVLLTTFVSLVWLLSMCAIWEVHKKFPRSITLHNFIAICLLLSTGLIIISRWGDTSSIIADRELNTKKRNGGIVVGTMCLINCVLLTSAAIVSYFQKYSTATVTPTSEKQQQQPPKETPVKKLNVNVLPTIPEIKTVNHVGTTNESYVNEV